MNQLSLMQSIAKYFARFSEQVKILNANNEFSINIHAENLLIHVLNTVYDLHLSNLNTSRSNNYAAIDLLNQDAGNRTAFQVTSTERLDKIKNCIEKYFRNGIYEHADSLYIFMLVTKQKSYSLEAINKKIEKELDLLVKKKKIKQRSDIPFSFDPLVNILDKTDLYRKLNEDNNLDNIIRLEKYLKQQFAIIDEKEQLSPYYQKLKNLFYESVLDDEKGLTLKDIYTEPSFSVHYSALKNGHPGHINIRKKKFHDADKRYKIHEFITDTLSHDATLGLTHKSNVILLLGYPGQGKSSFCKKFLNDYITNGKTANKPIFHYQLRNIRQAREFINSPLAVLYEEACEFTEQSLNKPAFYKSLLLLDGLDELYMRENLRLDEIEKVCIELIRLSEKHRELQIILTSRYGYIDDEKLTREQILITQLSPFTADLQKEWVTKYRSFHPEAWITEKKISLFNSNSSYAHIQELIEQPLLLHMIASVKNEITEDANHAKIYGQLFTELIERKYSKDGQLEILRNVSKEDLREFIREVAFAIFASGQEYITKVDLMKLKATQSFLRLLPEANFHDSTKGLMICFYFKEIEKNKEDDYYEDKTNYVIEFLHKSLREYMTAEKMFYSIAHQLLKKRSNERKYIIDDAPTALGLINDIFGKHLLTDELKEHLKQIAKNDITIDKKELLERLFLFYPDFVNYDFVKEYHIDKEKSVIEKSLLSAYAFWFLVSCLKIEKNYLTNEKLRQRTLDYFSMISNTNECYLPDLDLSYQSFSSGYISSIHFSACTFLKTDFSGCGFSNVDFDNCEIQNTSFDGAEFYSGTFHESNFKKSTFEGACLTDICLTVSTFNRVNFSDAEISGLRIDMTRTKPHKIFKKCKFEDAHIDPDSLERLCAYYPVARKQAMAPSEKTSTVKDDLSDDEEDIADNEVPLPDNYKRIIFNE